MTDNPGYVIKTEFIKKHDIVNRFVYYNVIRNILRGRRVCITSMERKD